MMISMSCSLLAFSLLLLLSSTAGAEEISNETVEYVDVVAMFPFTKNFPSTDEDKNIFLGKGKVDLDDGNIPMSSPPGLFHLAAYLMAVDHFNNRKIDIVSELANLSDCRIQIRTQKILDTKSNGNAATEALLNHLRTQNIPDVVIGGSGEIPVIDLSVVTSGLHVPFVTYGSFNQRVVTPYYYPETTRLASDVELLGQRVVDYLLHLRRDNYITILKAACDATSQLANKIILTEGMVNITTALRSYVPIEFGNTMQDVDRALASARRDDFRTIVLILHDPETELPLIAQSAERYGLNNGDYFWVLPETAKINRDLLDSLILQHPLVGKLISGAALIRPMEGFHANLNEDSFYLSWRSQSTNVVDLLNKMNPVGVTDPQFHRASSAFFQKKMPYIGASFVYDAVIAAGMGLCFTKEKTIRTRAIQSVSFKGASGTVEFGADPLYPGQRSAHTFEFGAFNMIPQNGTRMFPITDVFPSTTKETYSSARWQKRRDFYFADGTTSPPLPLRRQPEQHHLNKGVRVTGFVLWGFSLLIIITGTAWVHIFRKSSVVKASQPTFLIVIGGGCMLMSGAIFTNAFDEGAGWTPGELGNMCTATPWLIVVGHIMVYSALFAKLWRVNKVLQFRRNTVTFRQVLWPSAVLLALALSLLTVWTALEGFHWQRLTIDHQTEESIGKCKGVNTPAYFTPIFLLTIIPTLMTLWMSYQTRDIDSKYSETNWIYLLISSQVQVCVISIPVLRILEESNPNGRYVGQLTLFVSFSISPIISIIWPKIWASHFKKDHSNKRGSRGNARITGISLKATEPIVPGGQQSNSFTNAHRLSSFRGSGNMAHLQTRQAEEANQNTMDITNASSTGEKRPSKQVLV